MGFKQATLSSVIATLIATLISYIFDLAKPLFNYFVLVLNQFFDWLNTPIYVPTWMAALVVAALLFATTQILKNRLRPQAEAITQTETKPNGTTPLSKNEEEIISVLAKSDGQWLGVADMARTIGVPVLISDRAVESLVAKEFLIQRFNALHGTKYSLSSLGRDYAIDSRKVNQPNVW